MCSHLDHRPSAGLLIAGVTETPPQPERARCRTATSYGVAVDVERAAELYTQGWTLRQIGAELGLSETTLSDQLRRARVRMRRSGPPAHHTSTDRIVELRDQDLPWNEVAKRVDMTVSGAWSRYRRARPPKPPRFGALAASAHRRIRPTPCNWRPGDGPGSSRSSARAELTAARRAAHSLAASGRARVLHIPGDDTDAKAGDRNYLVLTKPNLIMNDIRLRGLAVGEVTLPGGRARTITPRRLGTLDAPSGLRLLVPG